MATDIYKILLTRQFKFRQFKFLKKYLKDHISKRTIHLEKKNLRSSY